MQYARTLERRHLGTLLIDLLTPEEEAIDDRTAEYRFDIPMLAGRLVTIVDWLRLHKETASLPIGLFGASTGGGAALIAAAERPREIVAVVSRGGRPDLADAAPPKVTTHMLLIVVLETHDLPRRFGDLVAVDAWTSTSMPGRSSDCPAPTVPARRL